MSSSKPTTPDPANLSGPNLPGPALVPYVRAAAIAEWLGVSRSTVFRLARAGHIPSVRLGRANGAVRFDPQAVARAVLAKSTEKS